MDTQKACSFVGILTVCMFSVCIQVDAATLFAPWPCGEQWRLTQGNNGSYSHTGNLKYAWDFKKVCGDGGGYSFVAAAAGTVVVRLQTGYNSGWGTTIVVDHGDGTYARYAHAEANSLTSASYVNRGDYLGRVGNTGSSSGAHLHFQVQATVSGASISASFADIGNPPDASCGGPYTSQNNCCTVPSVSWTSLPPGDRWYRSCERLSYSVGGTRPNTVWEKATNSGWQGGPYDTNGGHMDICWAGLGWHEFWVEVSNACGSASNPRWAGGWDDQAPTAAHTGGAAPGVWHKGNVSTIYTGSDAHSGFKDSRWWIENGPSGGWAGDNPRTVNIPTDSGVWRLWTEVADQAWTGSTQLGNSAQVFLGEFKVDNTAPSVSMPIVATNCINADTVAVTLSGSDTHSGIGKVHLLVNGQQLGFITSSTGTYNWSTVGLADGTYQIAARAEDAVGNLSAPSIPVSITIDRTSPAIEESLTTSSCPGGWYSGPVTLSFAATDALCGVATTSATLDSQPTVAPFTITDEGQHTVVLTATDNAGNVALETLQINIDLTAPSAPVINDGGVSGSLKTLAASWTADDTLSGIWDYECSVYTVETGQQVQVVPPTRTGGVPHFWKTNLTLSPNQEYFFQITAIDRACNQTTEVSTGVTVIPGTQDEGQTFAAGGVSTAGRSSGSYVLFDTFAEPIVGDTGGAGFSEVYAGYWTPELDIATVAALAAVWSLPDGKTVVFGAPLVVTAGTSDFAGRFWVQQPNRAQGMRVDVVDGSPVMASRDAVVTLSGKLATKGSERVLEYPSISVSGAADPVQPVYIPNHMLGGQAMSAMQPGVWQGEGLLNVGLLVKSTGWMYPIDSQRFLIIDGQGSYGASAQGVLVMLDNLAPGRVIVPPLAGYVVITGISSVAELDGKYVRCIRPRSQNDIEVVF